MNQSRARELASLIVQKAEKYGVKPRLLAAILMQESRYNVAAVNHKSKDYGIAQINHKNIKNLNMDMDRLLSDEAYSIEMGAMILGSYKKFQLKESGWWSRFNCGNRSMDQIQHTCRQYQIQVAKWF